MEANNVVSIKHESERKRQWKKTWNRFMKNKLSVVGLAIIVIIFLSSLLAPWIAPYPEDIGAVVNFDRAQQPPSLEHFFGTDEVGRDIFSRVLYGSRLSLILCFTVMIIAVGIGVPLGLIAGFWGGAINTIIMRTTDVFLAIPSLVLALAVAAVFEPSLLNTMIAISFGWWPWFTRLVQGEVLKVKNEQFVHASLGIGTSKFRIIFKEILPNCMAPIVVKVTLDMGFVLLLGASLGYLGLGAQPPTPEWGTMIAEGRTYLPEQWWSTTFPGLMIFITVLGFNLLGDGLRDVLDVELDD